MRDSGSSPETYAPYHSNCYDSIMVCKFYIKNKLNTTKSILAFSTCIFFLEKKTEEPIYLDSLNLY